MSDVMPQLACPFCGFNRSIGSSGFKFKPMDIDPSDYGVITLRSVGPGPGRGHKGERGEGFRTVGRLNIREALEDPEFSDIAETLRNRFITIIRSYIRTGVISMEEIID